MDNFLPGDPRSRYRNDPQFSALVNQIRQWIHNLHYTPSEVREAAMLAAVLEEMERPMAPFYLDRLERELDAAVLSRSRAQQPDDG